MVKNNHGFTLIELVIYIINIGIFFVIFINTLKPFLGDFYQLRQQGTLIKNMNFIMIDLESYFNKNPIRHAQLISGYPCELVITNIDDSQEKFILDVYLPSKQDQKFSCNLITYPEFHLLNLRITLSKGRLNYTRDRWFSLSD